IYFAPIEIGQSGGAFDTSEMSIPNIECIIDVKWGNTNKFIEKEIFPRKKYEEYLSIMKDVTSKTGSNFSYLSRSVDPISPFIQGTPFVDSSINYSSLDYFNKYSTSVDKINSTKKYEVLITKYKIPLIIKHPFAYFASL